MLLHNIFFWCGGIWKLSWKDSIKVIQVYFWVLFSPCREKVRAGSLIGNCYSYTPPSPAVVLTSKCFALLVPLVFLHGCDLVIELLAHSLPFNPQTCLMLLTTILLLLVWNMSYDQALTSFSDRSTNASALSGHSDDLLIKLPLTKVYGRTIVPSQAESAIFICLQ